MVAVGDGGYISKSTDQGQNWTNQHSNTARQLNAVSFVDSLRGWVVGMNGTILNTTNGGNNWTQQASGTLNDLTSVQFINASRGWAVGRNGVFLRTSDGGTNWQVMTSPTTNILQSVYFANELKGWVGGQYGTLLHSFDGGMSWNYQSIPMEVSISDIKFINAQTGWIACKSGYIFKTTNGGSNWFTLPSNTTTNLTGLAIFDDQHLSAVGENGTILRTSNGGSTWYPVSSGTNVTIHGIGARFGTTHGFAVGQIGVALKTNNSGETWINLQEGTTNHLNAIKFFNKQLGWAVGDYGTILKSENRGHSWQQQNSSTSQHLNAFSSPNGQNAWAVGSLGTIVRNNPLSSTWINQNSGTTKNLRSVHFFDPQTGWAVGDLGTILKTTNGGQNWVPQYSGTNSRLNSVYFVTNQIGWIVGEPALLKTTNGGTTWISQPNSSFSFKSIRFLDQQYGWAAGNGGSIFRTTNGGLTWLLYPTGTGQAIVDLHFIDSLRGWAVGNNGASAYSYNGGKNWTRLNPVSSTNLRSVCFIDPDNGWAAGEFGTILSAIPKSFVMGKMLRKTGGSCSDGGIPLNKRLVKASPGEFYGISNRLGDYELSLPVFSEPRTYTIKPIIENPVSLFSTIVCPPSGQILATVDTIPGSQSGKDFGLEIQNCHYLDLQLSSDRRRRCFRNNTTVSYTNLGVAPATDAYIDVAFPHWVRPISASSAHLALNDSVWRFPIGTVASGHEGVITIVDSVSCGNLAILGMSQCTKATIYPASNCNTSTNWTGAEVTVSGICENGTVQLGIFNQTPFNMPDSVSYWVYLDSVQVKEGKVKLQAGDSLKLSVQPNGMGVYLSVNQVSGHPGQVFVSTSVEGCGFTPQPLAMAVSTHLPIAQLPNSKTQCLFILGAFDPNDKQVFPIGFTNQRIVAPNTRLEYLIRFQNTGTDTAFNVRVVDTVDQQLNMESFEMGAASHPCKLMVETTPNGKTYLTWQFNNIYLPDSTTNEPESNGFIQFRIAPKFNLPLGSKVRNEAAIYFDFNPPIITNQTLTTYDLLVFRDSTLNQFVQVISSTEKILEKELGIKMYPNPLTQKNLTVSFENLGTISLWDMQGRQVFEKSAILGTNNLKIDLKPGLYIAKLSTAKGQKTIKLLVQ